ncbi:MAG: peptide chain release factor N(5)-glutamine methyltransferase [Clostridia bacterium]|nr:peptide chain release factor N(5)-glutamine methyltransferase [Clostridia bacterium]
MNIKEIVSKCKKEFNAKNIMDIYKLIAYSINLSMDDFLLRKDDLILTSKEEVGIFNLLNRYYVLKEPLQYITGYQNFYNEKYKVIPSVLIPRSDTEVLVEEAIKYINNYNLKTCLDLCTGSGAIGISIAKNSNIAKVYMSDISKDALDVAKENIELNNAGNKCSLILSNFFESINFEEKLQIIVSNPPYISKAEMLVLDEYVKKEPHLALYGGENGLDAYIEILKVAPKVLEDNGYIMLEIGYNQKEELKKVIKGFNCYEYVECKKDYAMKDRVIICRFHQK